MPQLGSSKGHQGTARAKALRRGGGGFTLMELMLSLVIMSIISVAVCTLTFGAMNTDEYLRTTYTAQSEIELAMRRITNNIRESQSGSITVGTISAGASTLSTWTQSDPADGYAGGATVSYFLQADPSNPGQQLLMETDQRYGTNTLVHNVTTFTVAPVTGTTGLYQVNIVIGTVVPVERHFQVFTRN